MPGRLVKSSCPTIRAQIACVYGTKEQGLRSEGTQKGQGKESCTKTELQRLLLLLRCWLRTGETVFQEFDLAVVVGFVFGDVEPFGVVVG